MKDAVKDRYERLKRAAHVISESVCNPHQSAIRKAENAGCLDEFDFLIEEVRAWLDDDDYYDDLAWNIVNGEIDLKA